MTPAWSACSGRAKFDELSGSTLTITSLGPRGGAATTPVIKMVERLLETQALLFVG